ncbi:septum formation initiator family protein [Desulfuromonas sp. AOP6]|uniref:FtsB family cell division protein n=1 Tax=Desulfuromonas sp. AOP6 TaxID=1566351 RepID=UPI00126D1DDD|nr:septum formation initiator family protein [Desulfuromonas sp. AOP6]BCA80421.1 septum formation initiator [Desulfuromonas sp. AOP6]
MSLFDSQTKKSPPSPVPLWSVLFLLFLFGVAVFGDNGVLRAIQGKAQSDVLADDIRRLEEENAALRQEIEALRSDRKYLEGIARKDLGMVKDDELVYQFPAEEKKRLAPTSPPVSSP